MDKSADGTAKVVYTSKEWRQNWARLIQKIHEVNPLTCPKCQGEMRVIKKILKHLNLWEINKNDPPPQNPSYIPELIYDDDYSQIPAVDYLLQKLDGLMDFSTQISLNIHIRPLNIKPWSLRFRSSL